MLGIGVICAAHVNLVGDGHVHVVGADVAQSPGPLVAGLHGVAGRHRISVHIHNVVENSRARLIMETGEVAAVMIQIERHLNIPDRVQLTAILRQERQINLAISGDARAAQWHRSEGNGHATGPVQPAHRVIFRPAFGRGQIGVIILPAGGGGCHLINDAEVGAYRGHVGIGRAVQAAHINPEPGGGGRDRHKAGDICRINPYPERIGVRPAVPGQISEECHAGPVRQGTGERTEDMGDDHIFAHFRLGAPDILGAGEAAIIGSAARSGQHPDRETLPRAIHGALTALAVGVGRGEDRVEDRGAGAPAGVQNAHVKGRRPSAGPRQAGHRPNHAGAVQRAPAGNVLRRGQVGVHRENVRHRDAFAPREIGVRQADRHRDAAGIAGHILRHDLGNVCRGRIDHLRKAHPDRAREGRAAGIFIIRTEIDIGLVGRNWATARVDPERHRGCGTSGQRIKLENTPHHVVAGQRPSRRHDRRGGHVEGRADGGTGRVGQMHRHLGATAIVHLNGRRVQRIGNAGETVKEPNARRGRLVFQRGIFASRVGQLLQRAAAPFGIGLIEQPLTRHHLRRHHNVHISPRSQAGQCGNGRGIPSGVAGGVTCRWRAKSHKAQSAAQPVKGLHILRGAKAFVGNPDRPHHFIPFPCSLHDRGLGHHQVRNVHRQKCGAHRVGRVAQGLLKARPREQLARYRPAINFHRIHNGDDGAIGQPLRQVARSRIRAGLLPPVRAPVGIVVGRIALQRAAGVHARRRRTKGRRRTAIGNGIHHRVAAVQQEHAIARGHVQPRTDLPIRHFKHLPRIAGILAHKRIHPPRNNHKFSRRNRKVRQRVRLPRIRIAHRPAGHAHRIRRRIKNLEPLVFLFVPAPVVVVKHFRNQQVVHGGRRRHRGKIPHQIGVAVIARRFRRRVRPHRSIRQRHRGQPRHIGPMRRRQLIRDPQLVQRGTCVAERVGEVHQPAAISRSRPGQFVGHLGGCRQRADAQQQAQAPQQPALARPHPGRRFYCFHARSPRSLHLPKCPNTTQPHLAFPRRNCTTLQLSFPGWKRLTPTKDTTR